MKNHVLLIGALVATCVLGFFQTVAQAADAGPKAKILLLTGDDVEPAHNWRDTSVAFRNLLVASGKCDVRICEDTGILESQSALDRYDAVVLALFNAKTPTLNSAARSNLVQFVANGKGLVVSHLASASFKDWDEFKKLCGRYWVMGKSGHGPRSVFKAKIVSSQDSITQGLLDFEADDELYAKLEGDAPIHVLVSADSDWSKRTEPIAFTLGYGKGRVFHETLGHDAKALSNPTVQTLIQRGCLWAASKPSP